MSGEARKPVREPRPGRRHLSRSGADLVPNREDAVFSIAVNVGLVVADPPVIQSGSRWVARRGYTHERPCKEAGDVGPVLDRARGGFVT